MKANADIAVPQCPSISSVVVVQRTKIKLICKKVEMCGGKSLYPTWNLIVSLKLWNLKILYLYFTLQVQLVAQRGLHTTGGYIVYASYTHEMIFDYHKDDIYWCTADIDDYGLFLYCIWTSF